VAEAEHDEDATRTRSSRTDELWAEVRVDPIEIALPGGVGYTLRAYRMSTEIARPTATARSEEESDEFEAASAAVARRRRSTSDEDETELDEADLDQTDLDETDLEEEDLDEDEEDERDDEDDEEEEPEQEVPVFLSRNGKLLLFHSPDALVEFIKSGAEHDLSQIDTWDTLVKRVTSEDIVPLEEDTYELDLVVENLRGGPDAWDPPLILRAGEIARDLSYALRIDPVLVALSSGTPLDELDEALRAAEGGGLSGMLARRRLRKIPAQQSSLAWRTIIGKISAAVDWRD
jgi:Nucleic-acid-binding protein possibly involved in ribosomal biogenesis